MGKTTCDNVKMELGYFQTPKKNKNKKKTLIFLGSANIFQSLVDHIWLNVLIG